MVPPCPQGEIGRVPVAGDRGRPGGFPRPTREDMARSLGGATLVARRSGACVQEQPRLTEQEEGLTVRTPIEHSSFLTAAIARSRGGRETVAIAGSVWERMTQPVTLSMAGRWVMT